MKPVGSKKLLLFVCVQITHCFEIKSFYPALATLLLRESLLKAIANLTFFYEATN